MRVQDFILGGIAIILMLIGGFGSMSYFAWPEVVLGVSAALWMLIALTGGTDGLEI